jgi:phage terminase small subunit
MKGLTEKQKKFCEEYMKNGFNGSLAYQVAYETTNKNVSASEAYRMLKDPKIQEELDNLESGFRVIGYKVGITKELLMKKILKMLNATKVIPGKDENGEEKKAPDYIAINNAINTYAKLTGDFTERKKIEVDDRRDLGDINPNELKKEQVEELKAELLKEL